MQWASWRRTAPSCRARRRSPSSTPSPTASSMPRSGCQICTPLTFPSCRCALCHAQMPLADRSRIESIPHLACSSAAGNYVACIIAKCGRSFYSVASAHQQTCTPLASFGLALANLKLCAIPTQAICSVATALLVHGWLPAVMLWPLGTGIHLPVQMFAAQAIERAAAGLATGAPARDCRWPTRFTTSSGQPQRPTAAWSAWACTTPSPGGTSWSCWQVRDCADGAMLEQRSARQGSSSSLIAQVQGGCQAESVLCNALH